MKNSLLIPNRYKVYGWVVFLLFTCLGLACMYNEFKIPGFQLYNPSMATVNDKNDSVSLDFGDYNLTNELALAGVIIGLLMIAFAKEKKEDEYISFLRLKSWQWSILISYLIFLICVFSFYGTVFWVVLIYNVFTVPVVFIVKFNYSLYQLRKGASHEN